MKFGMRAAKGAIEDFSINHKTFEPMIMTVGRTRPVGICGSGVINITAAMFEAGVLDNSGKFERNLPAERIRENNGIFEYVLAWAPESGISKDITISEIDFENLIRAKGAIYSGCMTLLTEVGLSIEDVEKIILAGGFGSHVDLEKAMTIGLLPEIAPERVSFIGNSSLIGAKMCLFSQNKRRDVIKAMDMMTNFELSETASYMDNYTASLFLPHTDLNRFPKVKERMANGKG